MNANPAASWGSVTVTATDGSITVSDSTAPTPDPMTFSVLPNAISDSAITMTATTATDDAFDVEYYFTCSAGPGNDSGWQSSPTYTDTGLSAGETYSYAVRARIQVLPIIPRQYLQHLQRQLVQLIMMLQLQTQQLLNLFHQHSIKSL